MNLILLFDSDFISEKTVRLQDRRLAHLKDIIDVKEGETLIVGRANGLMGEGKVIQITDDHVDLEVAVNQQPPKPLPITLILALPRPHVLKRTLICAASLGIKKIIILNFNRVEKSLWNSSSLRPEAIQEQLILGLEQAKDTILPEVILEERFKPFVEDKLPNLMANAQGILAHPTGEVTPIIPLIQPSKPLLLVIGPEGGLIDYEVQHFQSQGFQIANLGNRILRTESVLPYILGLLTRNNL